MKHEFYSLPLALDQIIQKRDHPRSSLAQSVAHHLHLVITTAFGELPSDENFGCCIWEYDFDNIISRHKIKEFIKESLLSSIQQYETRLINVRVDIALAQEESLHDELRCSVKKRINIMITANLRSTNEYFTYHDSFFTAPLSYQLI